MDLVKKGFQLPDKVEIDYESLTSTYGKFTAEAFEKGFGITIGNALRRVLLSSIEGSAVTSIKVPGVLHEFSTIQGVKEDVVEIILNVKQLRVKLLSDTPKVVTIHAKGPKEIKGKDISSGSQVEILNPDQHIASLGKGVDFKMELTVKRGRGYSPAERNKEEEEPVDLIAVDALFSPIKKVNFRVENARVGRSTDYDRLILEIWTDGNTTPQQALTQAADIISEHVALFSLEKESVPDEETMETLSEEEDNKALLNENLLKSVDELELSVRSFNCLKNANIRTIADLVQKTEQEMLRTKNFGKKSLNEIREVIKSMGLDFNMRIDPDALLDVITTSKGNDNAS
ncbi:DNA-directed RNA polymerase subunit alpha [bacterium]|nr:MAG: DNA-directed RNA polymerase subunit alpha [bacterium]